MSRVRSKDTGIELSIRKFLYKQGYRYRINYPIKGKPDIVFKKKKIAIFVHGCFWHQHGCKKSKLPESNSKFWEEKLMKNKARDIQTKKDLTILGWKVLTVWECEIKSDFTKIKDYLVDQIEEA